MLLPFVRNFDLSLAAERGRESAQLVQNWELWLTFWCQIAAWQLCFINECPCKILEGNRPVHSNRCCHFKIKIYKFCADSKPIVKSEVLLLRVSLIYIEQLIGQSYHWLLLGAFCNTILCVFYTYKIGKRLLINTPPCRCRHRVPVATVPLSPPDPVTTVLLSPHCPCRHIAPVATMSLSSPCPCRHHVPVAILTVSPLCFFRPGPRRHRVPVVTVLLSPPCPGRHRVPVATVSPSPPCPCRHSPCPQ